MNANRNALNITVGTIGIILLVILVAKSLAVISWLLVTLFSIGVFLVCWAWVIGLAAKIVSISNANAVAAKEKGGRDV